MSTARPKNLAAVVLLLLLFVATVSTATTVDITGEDGYYCRRVIRGSDLREFERFLRKSCRWRRGKTCRDHLEECCFELAELGRDCQCDGVRHVVRRQRWEMLGEEMEEMVQKARNLPALCGMGIGRCYIPTYGDVLASD